MEYIKTAEKDDMICLSDGKNRGWFEFAEMCVVDGKEYAALIQQGEDFPLIMELCENRDGKECYLSIDDDEIFEKVCAVFEDMWEED